MRRNNHTLTFDETTYTINIGKTTNDIFINGYPTDWYTDYDLEKIDDEFTGFRNGIRLKNRNDEDTTTFYLYLDTDTLRFHDVVDIIKIIIEESSRKKKKKNKK